MRKRVKRTQNYGLLKMCVCVYCHLCPTVAFDVEMPAKVYYRDQEATYQKDFPAKSIMCEIPHSGNTGLLYNKQQLNE